MPNVSELARAEESTVWELVALHHPYWVWTRLAEGRNVWQVTKGQNTPPEGPGGYFDLNALLRLKGLRV